MSSTGKKNPTFADVLSWAKTELETARTALESSDLNELETGILRARIAVMREVIAFPTKQPAPIIPSAPAY